MASSSGESLCGGATKIGGGGARTYVQTAHQHKWTTLLREALWQRAQVAIGQDRLAAAERDLRALRKAGGGFRDAQITGLAVYGLGVLAQRRGHGDAATALFEEALRYLDSGIEPLRVAECKHHLGKVALRLGDHEGADTRLREALAAREAGNRPREAAESLIALAELASLRGQHDLAAREWARAAALLDGLRSAAAHRPRLERAALDVLAGRDAEAEVRANEARKALEHHDPDRLLPFCHAVLLAVAAHKQSWRAYDLHLARAERSGGDCPPDRLRPLLLGWAATQAHADPARAEAAQRLAERWRALAGVESGR